WGEALLAPPSAQPNYLLRAQTRGHERQSGNPGRNGAAGQEKILAGLCVALECYSDAEHENEVHGHQDPIDGGQHRQVSRDTRETDGLGVKSSIKVNRRSHVNQVIVAMLQKSNSLLIPGQFEGSIPP